MNKLVKTFGGVLMSAVELLVGILLLINPLGFTSGIIMGAGILLIVLGVTSVIAYFRTSAAAAAQQQTLAQGLGLMLLGFFCAMKSEWFIAAFPLLTALYGVMTLAAGLIKVQWTVDSLRMKKGKWYWGAISAALSLICAAVILSNPFASTAVMWSFIGISLIVEAVADVLTLIFTGEKKQK